MFDKLDAWLEPEHLFEFGMLFGGLAGFSLAIHGLDITSYPWWLWVFIAIAALSFAGIAAQLVTGFVQWLWQRRSQGFKPINWARLTNWLRGTFRPKPEPTPEAVRSSAPTIQTNAINE